MSASFRRAGVTKSGVKTSTGPLFQKDDSVFRNLKGCKPWTGGYTLTSTGLREWDQMLCNGGGGQPLGTCIVIEEDRWTCDLALSLTRYWSAEAISQDQILMLVAMRDDESVDDLDTVLDESKHDDHDDRVGGLCPLDLEQFVRHRLPCNLHWEKEQKKQQQQQQSLEPITRPIQEFSTSSAILEENEEEDYDDDDADVEQKKNEDGLVNAWQYKLSVQEERLGLKQFSNQRNPAGSSTSHTSTVYCHSYDLSSKMKLNDNQTNNNIRIVNCSLTNKSKTSNSNTIMKAVQFYQACLQNIQNELRTNKNRVIRLLISNAVVSILSIAMPLLQTYIRQNDLPVVLLVTIRPWLLSSSNSDNHIHSLHRAADAVYSCESFASNTAAVPSEFSNLIGLLYVSKMAFLTPLATTVAATSLQANRFGLKRNRRKMEICMLHLPPEEFSNNGSGSVSGGGVRSGAGAHQPKRGQQTNSKIKAVASGCGSHSGTSSSLLDF